MLSTYTLAVLLLFCCYCHAQTIGRMRPAGFMPGTSPATPNLALDMCQRQTTPKQVNVTRAGKHAEPIHRWCTVYDGVLPCLGRTLPTANSASDWYLKLIYNQTTALRMSKNICTRFPYVSNLTCVDNDMTRVGKCMQWTTKSAIDHFYSQFQPQQQPTEQNKKLASIYACIISVATAGCFHKELRSCSEPQRKLMYDFYIMLSGKCRDIAGIPDTTTPVPEVTTAQSTPKSGESVQQNQLETTATGGNSKEPGQLKPTETSNINTRSRDRSFSRSRSRGGGPYNGSSRTFKVDALIAVMLTSIILSSL